MSHISNTLEMLEAAFDRILIGKPERISIQDRLSVRSVEREAGMGNGSAYYYQDLVEKVKIAKSQQMANCKGQHSKSDKQRLIDKVKLAEQRKVNYRNKVMGMREQITLMAAQHHQFADSLLRKDSRIAELEQELIKVRRERLVRIIK